MEINKQDFLKKIEKDIENYHFHEDKCDVFSIALFFGFFLIVLSIILLFNEISDNFKFAATFLMMFGVFLSVMMSKSIFVNNKMKKKYGKNPTKEFRVLIRDTCSIEDILEYYENASDTFKKYYLDVILEKEIAKSLGLKKDYDKAELLKKIKNRNKLEIENT